MKLVKIRFVRDAVYRVRGYSHPENPVFLKDSVHEFREDIARRWLKRGHAVVSSAAAHEEKKAEAKHGDELQAIAADAAPSSDGDDGGDKSASDKRNARKGVARNN